MAKASAKKKTVKAKPKGPPQKKCPICGEKVHVRKRQCSNGHKFPVKTARRKTSTAKAISGAAASPARTSNLRKALLAERESLQERIEAIDTLLKG